MAERGDALFGELFRCEEHAAAEVIGALGRPWIAVVNDPPWTSFRSGPGASLAPPLATVVAWDMDVHHLDAVAERLAPMIDRVDDADAVVVGFGGGTALDSAKHLSWKLGLRLIQVPTITSVDAGFTDAVGVRADGHVRYIGKVIPELVVIDLELIQRAPKHLNRAGIGDILSCHTGLFDWHLAAQAGHGPPWDDALAMLGRELLGELEAAAEEVAAVSDVGVRFLADGYRRIGAACAFAGHSRFEEGSEHFWAYAYEHATGAHPVHGEIISFAVCALAHAQGNSPEVARDLVVRSHVRAHPADLGVGERDFRRCLDGLAAYARAEHLDVGVADLRPITDAQISQAWEFVSRLPRRSDD